MTRMNSKRACQVAGGNRSDDSSGCTSASSLPAVPPPSSVNRSPAGRTRDWKLDAALLNASFALSSPSPIFARCSVNVRSEEHTSELQSQSNLVCRLLLEKKKDDIIADQEGEAVCNM